MAGKIRRQQERILELLSEGKSVAVVTRTARDAVEEMDAWMEELVEAGAQPTKSGYRLRIQLSSGGSLHFYPDSTADERLRGTSHAALVGRYDPYFRLAGTELL